MSRTITTPKGKTLYLIDLKGKDYLPVAERLVWFREERPDWSIRTEIISHTDKATCMRAMVCSPDGNTVVTAHKTETAAGFGDHMEKSETGAVGRALAMLGYGTQFTDDLEEGDRIVDAPAQRPQPTKIAKPTGTKPTVAQAPKPQAAATGEAMAGELEFQMLLELLSKKKMPKQYALTEMNRHYGVERVSLLTLDQFQEFYSKLEGTVMDEKPSMPSGGLFDDFVPASVRSAK